MAMRYNAGEIFEIALQIERNGARFYRTAADSAKDEQALELLTRLAEMEDEHERVFADMARGMASDQGSGPLYDPYDESIQYLRAVAGGHVFDLKSDPNDWLAEGRSMSEILHKAIGLEKDSIIFYLGIKEMVPAGLGKEKVDDIIEQEMNHITLLTRMIEVIEA
jgi:rubrerythrin